MARSKLTLTVDEVQLLVDTYEIEAILQNEEEEELLGQHNPELLAVYRKLVKVL